CDHLVSDLPQAAAAAGPAMSPHLPPNQPAPRPSRPQVGWVTVLIAAFGFILLLPGICGIYFAVGSGFAMEGLALWLWPPRFLALAITLPSRALRGPRGPRPPPP